MDIKSAPPTPDRRIAQLAARQHGVVSLADLAGAGLGRGAIAHRVRVGRLHVVHRGVYAVGHPTLTREARRLAAVLACGPSALLSHRSAAAHWELRPSSATVVDVTIASRAGRRPRPGLRVHRPARRLAAADADGHRGIPITSVPRTLIDLAEIVSSASLARAVERADELALFDLTAMRSGIARHPNRRGSARLAAVLEAQRDDVLTRSELEAMFLALCATHALPPPAVNARVQGHEVDFLWPQQRLVAETDGHRHHGTRAAFERDRARDAQLLVAGYRVVRFTYAQVRDEAAAVAATLRLLLARPGPMLAG